MSLLFITTLNHFHPLKGIHPRATKNIKQQYKGTQSKYIDPLNLELSVSAVNRVYPIRLNDFKI